MPRSASAASVASIRDDDRGSPAGASVTGEGARAALPSEADQAEALYPDLFDIGPFTVHSFGVMAALALIVPGIFIARDLRERGLDPALAFEIMIGGGVGGVVGAKVDFVLQNGGNAGDLFSGTGLIWYGGLIGGTVGVVAVALWRRLPVGLVANLAAPALAIGYAIGRIGCQLSGDGDYGTASGLPWSMSYREGTVPTTHLVHPTPLYETTAMLVVFWFLWRMRGQFIRPWSLFGLWCVLAGVERLLIEIIRRNPAEIGGLTTAQLVSIVLIAIGAGLLVRFPPRTAAPAPAT